MCAPHVYLCVSSLSFLHINMYTCYAKTQCANMMVVGLQLPGDSRKLISQAARIDEECQQKALRKEFDYIFTTSAIFS